VTAHKPDVVFVATGGVPHTDVLKRGNELAVSAWDILSGQVKPGAEVLLYDDAGDHTALQAAEVISAAGGRVEIVTPDRTFAPEIMAMNLVPYMRSLQTSNVTFTVTYRLQSVALDGNRLRATLGSDYGATQQDRIVDQVVVNHGTLPADDLYFELKPLSRNLGAVDYAALLASAEQATLRNPDGVFDLYRLGDAVAARNVHAAIYDAARLAKDI
jgi:thioredoxin reductase